MAIENYLGNGIVGDSTGKGIVGSNTGRGIVSDNTNNGSGNSTENVGNIYMHPPYAVVVEPTNEGGNVTQGNKNYQATYNAYKAAAAKLVDQTEEALTAKAAWSTPPSVSIENGKLTLNGSDAFLKSNEAAQLRKTLKAMEGKTYNTEDLNKQIEAWNTALSEMSKGYLDTVDAMNQANYALSQSAENNEYHKLTISDMQKIGNSASIGKQPDAKTTKNKIFVGFEWDDDGNMKEKWVEAKDFYEEFNSMDDDKKRSAYHSLVAQANNGDVGAYSKLTYLNGGSEGKPTNVEYDAVGDFFHTFGENMLTGLAEAADFVTTYIPVFNTARLTGRIVRAAGAGDINEFFKSDDIRNMIDDYEDVVSWENSYFSELTPGSTQAAAISGSVVGNVLGMAYSIWAGGVGNAAGLAVANAATQPIKLAIASANQSLVNSGKFVAFSRSTVTGARGAMGGAVRTAGSVSNRFLIPTAIVEKFPSFSSALADTALKFSEMSGIGNTGATAAQALSGSEKAVTLVTNTVGAGANVVSKTSMVTLAGKTLAQEKAIATGIQTAFRLAPLAGEVALRHTDQYFQKLNAGEEVGELSDYVFENTVKDMAWGAAFMAAGAGFKKLKDVAKAAKKSPADAASAASYASENTQQGFYNDSHFTYDRGSNYLPSGLERTQDFQEFVSTIMTVNGEGIYAVPNSSAPMTVSAVPGTDVAQESGKVFGVVSKNVIKQYEVEPVSDGANVVETVTNLDGTKTISKQHFDSIDEANDAVRGKTVPTTSPKTLSNNDQVADIKVAPLTVDGVAPETLPEGVSQIKFVPGTVYRTPDGLADEIADLVDKAGGSFEAVEAVYQEAVEWASNNMDEPAPETPFLPERLSSDFTLEDRELLRAAAWAKAHGYNAVPLRVPTSYSRAIKKFSLQDKFISKEDILNEGKRLSEFSVALYQDVRDLNSIRNSWSDNYEYFYESIKADTARDEDFARRLLSFERGKDSVSRDYLWDKLRDSARNTNTLDAFYDSSRGIIDSELERIEAVRRGARPDKNVLATTDDYKFKSPSKKFVPSDERKAIYDKYMDQNAKTGWFIYAQPGSKKAVADSIKANPELRNAMLSEMYELSGSKLPYGEWLDTPMELHRVQIYDLPGEEDDFLSFSMNEDWGDHWRSEYTDAGIYYGDVPGDDTSLTIKPRDTFGAHIVADNEVQNTEVLVPREAYMNAWENSDTAAKRSLENDAELERLMAEENGDGANGAVDYKVDGNGVKTKAVSIDGNDVDIDYGIADQVSEMNGKGYKSLNSHSGLASDHEMESDAGHGYIQFSGRIGSDKKADIKRAAEKADMTILEQDNLLYGPVLVVYQNKYKNGQSYQDLTRQANLNTINHYKLPRKSLMVSSLNETETDKSWLTLLDEKGKMSEGLKYRDAELKRLIEETGGLLQDTDDLRKASWDTFFGELGIEKQYSGGEIARVRQEEVVETPHNIVGMQYGVPYEYFANESDALAWAKEEGGRAVHRLDDNADILTRPPVTTEDLVENPLLLGAGEGYVPHVERFDELMTALPTLMEEGEGAIDYLRGIVDIAREVNAVYTAVAANVNLDDIYSRYAKAIYDGEEVSLTPDEKKALEPITHMLDVLGHYFDPSGKSLTQEFYLPTALAANKMVNIEKALLKGEDVDLEHPVDTGFNDILLDLQRIGDAGFWQKRTGDLFRDEDGNFTMARAGTLQNALTSYTVSALTRGKNSLAVAVNNEVAKSKYDRNRSQITEKQAYAGIKEADKIRGKTKSYRAAISKDADKISELKEDYDESAVDQAMKAKNYSKDLGFVKSTNHAAQLLGYNQFLEMTPIQGGVIRYGTQGQVYRGTTNIRRKMEKINITGPMWVTRFGAKQRIGFGLEASEANTKKYGVFKAGEPAVNLGRIVSMNFDSDTNALAYLYTLKGVIKSWSTGDGMDMVTAVNKYARENFPLLDDYEWNAAKLLKELARNYHASADPMAVDAMNVDSISKWIRDCTATCFNNAIMMTDISNLDERTLEALDEAAAYIYVGSPLKRNKVVNAVLKWESVAKLGGNVSPMLGNIVSEIFTRLPGYIGWKDTTRALKRALDTKESARINNIISDLPSHYDSPEDDTMLQTAKKLFGTVTDKATGAALKPLTWSEKVKNLVYYAAGEINAERKGITDPAKKQLEAIRFVGEHAIAGGKGTTPGVAESSLGRTLFLFRTFTIRNFDDFIDFVEKASRGETGDNYWDAKYEKKYGKNNKDRFGRNKASFKLGAKAVGGRLMRSYVIWLTILSYFGKGFMDALGGDPTGITDGGKDRGLYDDEDTDEYEGMTDFDNFINSLPAGVIFGSLQDLYFAARRRGVDSKQFMAFDLWNDQKLNNDMSKHLPLGVAYNRFADMLDLLDRGYSFSSTGKKTYAAPETALDVVKGFLFGKATTENSLAYGKYRYGTVNIWGDLSSGDWMDFAMNANPLKDITGSRAQFDTTRKDYTGVFDGSWNDIATMQLIVAQFKERQQTIIDEYNRDKYRYGGDYEGLTDAEKVAKAKETREKKIDTYTEDVQRAVNAFTDAGNALSDKQITNLMYLFDFHEGEEDDEWNSSAARERYVEAGLPDYNAAAIQRTTKTEDGEKKDVTKNYLDRSLILQNAQQGFYGSSKKAANAVKDALSGFDSTYKAYKERVKALNDKYFTAREKNKKSAETKQLSKDLEKLQNEYLDKLYQQLTPVVEQYGTALIGTYDVADVLEDYMSNMIPYSSIKKYGQTYSSGNDIVYGQLAEWLQKRWGRNAPTAPSDKEVTNGISEIKKLLDQGKTAAAKSKARAILEKIGRGSLGARRYDVETLRDVAYD